MILAIDVGNTNIVLGVWADEMLCLVSRLKTDRQKTEDGYAVELKNILGLYKIDLERIDGAIISSVVPQISGALVSAVDKLTGRAAFLVGPGIKTGLNILIDNPAQLGSDMVVEAVAAIVKYHKPVIIIDLGTATKISAVDKSGNFLGCAIMPGIRIGLDALSERTAALPQIGLDAPREAIGRNTVDSMKSGAVLGTASMIDGMIERFEQQLGQTATVVATGGFSGDIVPYCTRSVIHDPNLMLEGLYRVYLKNQLTG
jgi:type III pantothenate kinase